MREAGSREVRQKVSAATIVATSRVAYPEARAAFARRGRARGITAASLSRIVSALDRDFDRLVVVELNASLAKGAGDLATRLALRGFDAIHLASALELEKLAGSRASFLCFDDRLRNAALAEGLAV